MASRYHWLTSSNDTAWTGVSLPGYLENAIPAGGVLKRFLVNSFTINGKTQASDDNVLQPVYANLDVDIMTGDYAGHKLFHASRMVPCESLRTWVGEAGFGIVVDTQIMSAGDLELGFNQKCSYGGLGKSAFVVRFTPQIVPTGPNPGLATGRTTYQFRTLYYL